MENLPYVLLTKDKTVSASLSLPPGEEPHVAVCQLSDCESHVRLSDQREHDTAAEELWVHLSAR